MKEFWSCDRVLYRGVAAHVTRDEAGHVTGGEAGHVTGGEAVHVTGCCTGVWQLM